MNERAKKIINFWFIQSSQEEKFTRNKVFDKKIKQKFFTDYKKAINNEYNDWQNNAKECLALIIILDQFSRNLFRNNSKAFAMDKKARILSIAAINHDYCKKLSSDEILFIILPLIHSENLNDHNFFYKIFDTYFKNHPKYLEAKKMNSLHTDIIKRFNRYPYRNKVLCRKSTKEEIEYLNSTHHKFFNI